jgi:small subunit ribosomal protein S1
MENPWERLAQEYSTGTQVEGTVSRIHKSGIVVDLPSDVEGFVPMSHLALPEISKIEARFAPGDPLPLEVIEVSPDNRRIVLSVKAHMEKQSEEVLTEYIAAHEIRPELLEPEPEPEAPAEATEEAAPAEAEATEEVATETTDEATEEVTTEATDEATEEVATETTDEATKEVVTETADEATEEPAEEVDEEKKTEEA